MDLHKDVGTSLGDELNFYSCRDLKSYSLPKDQSIFGPIRQLPMHILTTIGLFDSAVTDHIEATSDIAQYHSTLSIPISQTTGLAPKPKEKKVKLVSKRKTPSKTVTKGIGISNKWNTITEDPIVTEEPI